MVETWYELGKEYGMVLAVLADIHNSRVTEFLTIIEKNKTDLILIPGDLVDGAAIEKARDHERFVNDGVGLLNRISTIAPTYFSLGNHEKRLTADEIKMLYKSAAVVVENRYVKAGDLYIGGLSSGRNYHDKKISQVPDVEFIDEFEKLDGYKILLSHHPEYYEPHLKNRKIDLIVSGHAHGGQVRILGRGLYAPGQGLFPKYTSGIHDKKLIVSRGIAGTEIMPRINNEPEVVFVKI